VGAIFGSFWRSSNGNVLVLSNNGSREVSWLVIEEALALKMELASVTDAVVVRNGMETPDIEEADEANPVRR
jgi:hypothetical protein